MRIETPKNLKRVALKTVFTEDDLSQALDQVARTLKPERILLVTREMSRSPSFRVNSHGFPEQPSTQFLLTNSLQALGVSLSNIENVMATGKAINCIDADESSSQGATDSVIMTGIRSILCAPIKNTHGHTVGVLYADDRKRRGMFSAAHVEWVLSFCKALGGRAQVETVADYLPAPEPATRQEIWSKIRKKGLLAKSLGSLEIAEKCLIRALAYCRCRDLKGLFLARTLNDLAEVLRLRNKFEAAGARLKECLQLAEEDPAIDYRTSVPFRNNLAGLRHAEGRTSEAKQLYLQILGQLDRASKKDAKAAIPILANLGTLHLQGSEFELAVKYLSKAALLARNVWGEDHVVFKQCQKKLAECPGFARYGGLRKPN